MLREMLYTAFISMAPVIELRGGIPLGIGLGLTPWQAYFSAVIGNLIPVPVILIFVRRVFRYIKSRGGVFADMIEKLEQKAHLKGRIVRKYRSLGLVILVAIPIPGTGAWTGALAAAFLDMRLRDALPAILTGVLVAGIIVSGLSAGVISIFA